MVSSRGAHAIIAKNYRELEPDARIAQAGATTTSIPTLCGELAGDFREPLG
jgi:hypothetical protein